MELMREKDQVLNEFYNYSKINEKKENKEKCE